MIVTRTPLRICFAGGGTDLPNFASRYGGLVLSGTIDCHVDVVVRCGRLDGCVRYSYDTTETVPDAPALRAPIVREALRRHPGLGACDVVSLGPVPCGTGLGSSGAFTVGLLHALQLLEGHQPGPTELAEEAWDLECNGLGRHVGKHDHYTTGLGGMRLLRIARDGSVAAESLRLPARTLGRLERSLLLVFTGRSRDADRLLGRQDIHAGDGADRTHYLHDIKRIGLAVIEALQAGDLDRFGHLLHEHWQAKSRATGDGVDPQFAALYRLGRASGALGGKVLGAGGGGFFLFYTPEGRRAALAATFKARGFRTLPFRFDQDGSRMLLWDQPGSTGGAPR